MIIERRYSFYQLRRRSDFTSWDSQYCSATGGVDSVGNRVRTLDSVAECWQGLEQSQQSDYGHRADPGISDFPRRCGTGNSQSSR